MISLLFLPLLLFKVTGTQPAASQKGRAMKRKRGEVHSEFFVHLLWYRNWASSF